MEAWNGNEGAYYAIVTAIGCFGALCRQLRGQDPDGWRARIGGVLSGGVFSFGSVGIWIGRTSDGGNHPFYFLAVAAFVGFYSLEAQSLIGTYAEKLFVAILKRWGLEIEPEDDTEKPDPGG